MLKSQDKENEFTVIRDYFSGIGLDYLTDQGIKLSVGDDASVIKVPPTKEQVVSVDTSIEGVHFPKSMKAEDIAYRSVAVALSDLAACGASPAWFTLAISLKEINHKWLSNFKKGLQDISKEFAFPLIGGDTTKGNLCITVQVAGYVDIGKTITRSGAKIGDLIYVTGTVGDASLGLRAFNEKSSSKFSEYVKKFSRPKARIGVGEKLLKVASSSIDISDGLIQDLNQICVVNGVGANVFLKKIPSNVPNSELANLINSGDDYEICFTAQESFQDSIDLISRDLGVSIKCIGEIIEGKGVKVISESLNPIQVKSGYKHF